MNYKIIFISLFFIFVNSVNAKNYSLNILLDNQSNKYFSSIKKELHSLLSSDDNIKYKIEICSEFCEKRIKNNNFILLNKAKKFNNYKNKFIISYNFISTVYDENKLVRASALAIYEHIKEHKKTNSLYLENKILVDKEKIINEENDKKQLNLNDIFSLALKNNIQIKENLNNLKIDKLNTDESKSYYKPKIDFYSNLLQIDSDRAKYSNGLYSEGTLDIGVKLTQVIYSNKVIKNIEIKKLLEKSNTNNIKAQNDEILYRVLITYLNIIKANNYNDIIKIKQNFIKQNLLFSEQRVEIGVKDRSDVYRWQSELANVNIELSNSSKQLETLKIELSNLLQIKNNFSFKGYSLKSKVFKILDNDAIKYISNKKVQENFLTDIIFSHSRLKQLSQLINAKNEEYKMNKSSKYLPSLNFEGSARKIVDRYGEGSDTTRYWDDKEYQALINLSLPLYEGGIKNINVERNEIELINLKLQYNNIKNLIEKNVKQNYHSLKKSYEKIAFAKTSQKYSKKNYELIQDKYNNGKENIISLLDAQNSYIVSKLNENISVIDYLVDLSSIYYFSGNIEILVDKNKKYNLEEKILNAIKQ